MIGVRWFFYQAAWHALVDGSDVAAECGLRLAEARTTVTAVDEEPLPPAPCPRCLLRIGEQLVIDEPLDEAMTRGFTKADLAG